MYINKIDENKELVDNFKMAKLDLDAAYNNYQFASNDATIDYYIYQIKACQARFDAILKKLKQQKDIVKNITSEAS